MKYQNIIDSCWSYRVLVFMALFFVLIPWYRSGRLMSVPGPGSELFNQSGSDRPIMYRDTLQSSNMSEMNYSGMTPLSYAVFKGDWERVSWELRGGANINAVETDEGNTPLHLSVMTAWVPHGVDILRLLLDNYAAANAKTYDGNTPIHIANSLMDVASKVQVIRELVLNGCDINARNGGLRRSQFDDGFTVMHLAAARHDTQAIDALMAEFASIIDNDVKDFGGHNAYVYARDELLSPDVADRIAGPYFRITKRGEFDRNGLSGLHIAAMRGDTVWAQQMVDAGEEINVRTKRAAGARDYGYMPLHLAVLYQQVPMVVWLLAHHAAVAPAWKGNTPVHVVVRGTEPGKRVAMLQKLLEKDPRYINVQNADGETLLHLIVRVDDQELLRFVLRQYGKIVDCGIKNKEGETPLSMASRMGRVHIMRMIGDR